MREQVLTLRYQYYHLGLAADMPRSACSRRDLLGSDGQQHHVGPVVVGATSSSSRWLNATLLCLKDAGESDPMAVERVAAMMEAARARLSTQGSSRSKTQRRVCYCSQCAKDEGKAASRAFISFAWKKGERARLRMPQCVRVASAAISLTYSMAASQSQRFMVLKAADGSEH